MGTARQKQEAVILTGLYTDKLTKGSPNKYENYTILDALADVYKLEQAGTLFGALDAINSANADTTKKNQDLQASIKAGGGNAAAKQAEALISP